MLRLALLATALSCLAPLAHAGCGGTATARSDNDVYGQAGQDQGYSAGFAFAWATPTVARDEAGCLAGLDRATRWLAWGPGTHRNLVLTWHHSIYTPTDGTRADLVLDDRPYAGTMLFGIGQQVRDGNRLAATHLRLGIVGPSAQGEMAQDSFHHLFGRERFRGWDNQLRDEPLLQLAHERVWRHQPDAGNDALGWDRNVWVGGALGSPSTYANAGVEFRFGKNLPDDFGSNPMRLAGDGTAPVLRNAGGDGWDWHFFASLEARAVAYDVTLDGTLTRDSHSVESRAGFAELGLGVVLTHGPWRLAGGHYRRSREFSGQREAPVYGSVSLSRRF